MADSPTHQLETMSLEDVKEKYRAVCMGGGSEQSLIKETVTIDHPVVLLHAIQQNPQVAEAVLEIEFTFSDGEDRLDDDSDSDDDPDFHGSFEAKTMLQSMTTHPLEMVAMINLNEAEKTTWKAEIDVGRHAVVFAVLLTKLPCLRKIGLIGMGDECKPYLDKVFQYAGTTLNTFVLSSLKEAYVSHWDTEYGQEMEVIDELVLIPSLTRFHAHLLGDEGENDYQCLQTKAGDTRISNIEEVEITCSYLDQNDIVEFLKPLVNLKKMDYEGRFDWSLAAGCEDGTDEFREVFEDGVGDMLEQRDLIWKANDENLVIRKKELAAEIEDFDEQLGSSVRKTHTVQVMPDGTERHMVGFG